MNNKHALEFAEVLADAAHAIALAHFRAPLDVNRKADESPVTIVDKKIELTLREMIHAGYPRHGILGEEYGSILDSDYTWTLDPIDGTKSFVMGNPLFGTLIGLLHQNKPFIGLASIPATRERWLGNGKCTTFRNGVQNRKVTVSTCQSIKHARLYIASMDLQEDDIPQARNVLINRVAIARPSCDCYAYGLLAMGHCDLVIETGLEPYDYLPLVPIVEGAGGWITDWGGMPLGFSSGGRIVAAASKPLLDATIDILAGS